MLFSSYIFLFVFLPGFLLLYGLTPSRFRYLVLLAGSYLFYGFWRFDFLALLIISTTINYGSGHFLHGIKSAHRRKFVLGTSVVANLGILGYFKYANFGIENFNALIESFGFAPAHWTTVVLPIGISFFTFQAMSYTIDVYRGTISPTRNFPMFAAYVAMFPQLVAGPIVRYSQVQDQFVTARKLTEGFGAGVLLFMIGFNKKVLFADQFGVIADQVFDLHQMGLINAWIGAFSYSFQIYFDFSGYSDMALGLGLMLGFKFPENFNSPYRARSISDFWRRWHMTLSLWFRDYVYIPLGGNRTSKKWRTYFNLMATMLLTGIWHGAQWTFILWGLFHAAFLMIERRYDRLLPLVRHAPAAFQVGITFVIVTLGWVLFRSSDIETAFRVYREMFNFNSLSIAVGPDAGQPLFLALAGCAIAVTFIFKNSNTYINSRGQLIQVAQLGLFLLACHELFARSYSPFLYFQF